MVLLSIFLGSLAAYAIFLKAPKNLGKWERSFIEAYLEKLPHDILKLQFDSVNKYLMETLCRKVVWERELRNCPPKTDTNFLGFKKEEYPSFLVEMITCNKKYAIVSAPQKYCGFVLRKSRRSTTEPPTFYIHKKICLKRIPHPKSHTQEKTGSETTQEKTGSETNFLTSSKDVERSPDAVSKNEEGYEPSEPESEILFESTDHSHFFEHVGEKWNSGEKFRIKSRRKSLTEYESDDEDELLQTRS